MIKDTGGVTGVSTSELGGPEVHSHWEGAERPSGLPSPVIAEVVTLEVNPTIEAIVRTLEALKPQSQELVAIMVRQLAEQEGITASIDPSKALKTPADGIPLWVAKMKQESYSPRTISLYLLTVKNYLQRDPRPTKLSIQQWLADRLETLSSAKASIDRKALRNFFSFLFHEGLWPNDPTATLKHIKVSYRQRDLPPDEDVLKLVDYECFRKADTAKFRTMVTILITTGLRITEAASIRKENIFFDEDRGRGVVPYVKIIGKGNKEGIVPLVPETVAIIKWYLTEYQSESPFLFPGNTPTGFMSVNTFERTLKRACRKLGIKEMTPHQLRHFFATYALKRGAKLEVVSRILRHASVAITADIYRHVGQTELHETALKFNPLHDGLLALPEGEGHVLPDRPDSGD